MQPMYDYTDNREEYIRGRGEPPETPTWLFVVVLYVFFGTWLFLVQQVCIGVISYVAYILV